MKTKRYKLPERNEELKTLIDQGMTVKQIAEKFNVTYSAVYNRIQYHVVEKKEKELTELTKLIYDKGYSLVSLSREMGYSDNVMAASILYKRISMEVLNCMATKLDLTDNQIARIVKGDLI